MTSLEVPARQPLLANGGEPGRDAATNAARPKPGTDRPVLIVLHQERSTPGRVGQLLTARGYRLDIRRPALGDTLPRTLCDHAAAVIFGGPMSANDADPFIRREIDFIDVPLSEGRPFLGICLGAQMLARAIGGKVTSHPNEFVEIGYYDLAPTTEGRALMDWPRKVYQWHREGFDVSDTEATVLAKGEHFEQQAFVVGSAAAAYGIQFHPELTLAMMYRWTTKGSARMQQPGARHRRDHFAGRAIFDPAVKAWLGRFLDLWLGRGAGTPATAPQADAAERCAAKQAV